MSKEQTRKEFEAWWVNFQSEHEEWKYADREAILFQTWLAAIEQAKNGQRTSVEEWSDIAHWMPLPSLPEKEN